MQRHPNRAIRLWVAFGLLAYLALPWYAIQDSTWYSVLPQILGGPETASGLIQAMMHKRKWLMLGLAGLVICMASISMPPGRKQGNWLIAGGLIGSLGLAASGFLIGAKGWSFEFFNAQFGELALQQFGMGAGAACALISLVVLTAFGVARRGFFKGDLFVAASVIGCAVLLLLFIGFQIGRAHV